MTTDFKVEAKQGMLPEEIAPQGGLLTDGEIEAALDHGYLFTPETAKRECIRYASYQLRIGTDIRFLSRRIGDDGKEQEVWEEFPQEETAWFEIKPNATAKIFSAETLNIPHNVIAHAIPVGNLYELGLTPEVTFADPGYHGDFWVVVCNYSPRVVQLKVGTRLARMEFTKLNKKPDKIHTGLSAVKKPERPPYRLRKKTPDELSELDLEAIIQEVSKLVDPPHYEHAFVTERVRSDFQKELALVKSGFETELNLLKAEDHKFTKNLSILKIPVYVSLAICAVFLWGKLVPHLPAELTSKLTTAVFGGVVAILTIAATAIQKDVRNALTEIFQKKET